MSEIMPVRESNTMPSVIMILSTAWKKIDGCKWPIWIMLFTCFLLMMIVFTCTGAFFGLLHLLSQKYSSLLPLLSSFNLNYLFNGVIWLVVPLLTTGAVYAALQHCRGTIISWKTGFIVFSKHTLRLILAGILVYGLPDGVRSCTQIALAGHLGLQWVIGIVLVCYMLWTSLTLLLILDKNLTVLQALSVSFQKTFRYTWTLIGVGLCNAIMLGVLVLIVMFLTHVVLMHFLPTVVIAMDIVLSGLLAIWVIPYLLGTVNAVIYQVLIDAPINPVS